MVDVSLTCGGCCWRKFPSMRGGCYLCEFPSMQHLAAAMQRCAATTQCNATLQHVRCVGLFPLVAMQCLTVTHTRDGNAEMQWQKRKKEKKK